VLVLQWLDPNEWTPVSTLAKEKRQQLIDSGVLQQAYEAGIKSNGNVHGDLHGGNVLVKQDGDRIKVMFVDFDWCGKQGEAHYPSFMNHFDLSWHADARDGQVIMSEHDEYLLRQPHDLKQTMEGELLSLFAQLNLSAIPEEA